MSIANGQDQAKATVNSEKHVADKTKENTNTTAQKKKRPRQRIRQRNKACRLAAAVEQLTAACISRDSVLNELIEVEQSLLQKRQELQVENLLNMNAATTGTMPQQQDTHLAADKAREQIKAEREAKKLAKLAKKTKSAPATITTTAINSSTTINNIETNNINHNLANENVASEVVHIVCNNDLHASDAFDALDALADVATAVVPLNENANKTREQIKAEREAKRQTKLNAKAAKQQGSLPAVTQHVAQMTLTEPISQADLVAQNVATNSINDKKKPALSKAERRAIQEAQRAAKAQAHAQIQKPGIKAGSAVGIVKNVRKSSTGSVGGEKVSKVSKTVKSSPGTNEKKIGSNNGNDGKVKLFHHLEQANHEASLFVNNPLIHPAIARLGEQYAKRSVVGSNARCIAFLNALKMVIKDFETPVKKEFTRSLETSLKHCVKHLQACRPLAVSVSNAYKHIKHLLTQLPADNPESDSKEHLCQFIDTYIENQICKAAEAISESLQEKIKNGDVILTFGCSSLINYILEQAHRRHVDFRVIVVDSRPLLEGQELLRRLTAKEIPCTYVLINAVGFVMPEATKVLLGAHALLSNGYVMARTGTAQVALVARSYNVPVLVCCETHKFSERFQTDAIVYNELGDPEALVQDKNCSLNNWQNKSKMTPLNLMYDITPPELVTAVVTDVSILPCTSVPVILRIKPAEIGYYN